MDTEQKLKSTFGYNVFTRRDRMGLSQEALAEKAGVSKNTISDIETGQKFARAKTLVQLAKALETDVYELLKPKGVLPDKAIDVFAQYGEEVKDAVEKIENRFRKKMKQ